MITQKLSYEDLMRKYEEESYHDIPKKKGFFARVFGKQK